MKAQWRKQAGGDDLFAVKSIVVDGGSEYDCPYLVCSTGEVLLKPEWKNQIGEADMKIVFYTNHVFPRHNLLVRTIIIIILLRK